MRAAFQGEEGAYSEEALRSALGAEPQAVGYATLDDVFAALARGAVDRAVVPIENSLAGSIHRTYDLLRNHDLPIVDEVVVRIDHCLLARPGATRAGLREVHSHPQAIEQCEAFLRTLGCALVAHLDTAGAARMVAQSGRADVAAVASRRAAQRYGLAVLAEGIQTAPDNQTRFYVLAKEPAPRRPGPQKTCLLLRTQDAPGALHGVLEALARRGVNLVKLESRPSRGRPFEYLFYLDLAGHADDPPVREALAEVSGRTTFLRVLGSFPRASGPQVGPR
ncbi:MAG TPA: prephenate dehydratase [Candidatus Thermoplasmatota archaeon]|nr:prephenate dehydratase [Candidatus Thermoplasmatota archaeon]